jgi:hypothetical protein
MPIQSVSKGLLEFDKFLDSIKMKPLLQSSPSITSIQPYRDSNRSELSMQNVLPADHSDSKHSQQSEPVSKSRTLYLRQEIQRFLDDKKLLT